MLIFVGQLSLILQCLSFLLYLITDSKKYCLLSKGMFSYKARLLEIVLTVIKNVGGGVSFFTRWFQF